MSKKAGILNNLFCSIIFGAVFTFAGGFIQGHIDWPTIPVQILVGTVVGFLIGLVIPSAKWGSTLGAKAAKPGTVLFKFIMYSVILLCMLVFMCPIITIFVACVLNGAPFAAVSSTLYAMFLPFYIIGILILLVVGDLVAGLAVKLASK